MPRYLVRLKSGERLELSADKARMRKIAGEEVVEFTSEHSELLAFFEMSDVAGIMNTDEVKPFTPEGSGD